MVAVLFAVGDGLEDPAIVQQLLDVAQVPSKPSYEMAAELPLVLFDCAFEDVRFFGEPGADCVFFVVLFCCCFRGGGGPV
jgi:tRNA pseudouridine38/39 synthase